MQPIWTVCLDDVVRYVVSVEKQKDNNKNVETLLNMFSKQSIDVVGSLLEEILQDQLCAKYLKRVHLPVLRSRFVAGGYTPCLVEYIENGDVFGTDLIYRNGLNLFSLWQGWPEKEIAK